VERVQGHLVRALTTHLVESQSRAAADKSFDARPAAVLECAQPPQRIWPMIGEGRRTRVGPTCPSGLRTNRAATESLWNGSASSQRSSPTGLQLNNLWSRHRAQRDWSASAAESHVSVRDLKEVKTART
jgi:hypothetical protein